MMERADPVLFPQWYNKAANGSTGGTSNSNNQAGPSVRSENHGAGTSSKSRISSSFGNRDSTRPSGFGDRSWGSSRGNLGTDGFTSFDKDSSSSSHPYKNFGRGGKDKGRDSGRVRDRSLIENGCSRDKLRRSNSIVLEKQADSWAKRPGNNSTGNNSKDIVLSGGSMASSWNKSFEREFPTLGVNGNHRLLDRVPSPGLSSLQTSSTTPGLSMAGTLAQAPALRSPQLSVDIHRIEELTSRQCRQLIPLTPKSNAHSSVDKSKSKAARCDLIGPPKVGQQPMAHPSRPSGPLKASQPGNFQVLTREKNAVPSVPKDIPSVNRAATPLSPNLKADGKAAPLLPTQSYSISGEKRPHSQSRDRYEFFNGLRNQTSANNSNATPSPFPPEKSDEQRSEGLAPTDQENNNDAPASGLDCSAKVLNGGCDAIVGPERCPSDGGESVSCLEFVIDLEEEAALLISLGWNKDGDEEALTAEEIAAFVEKHGPYGTLC